MFIQYGKSKLENSFGEIGDVKKANKTGMLRDTGQIYYSELKNYKTKQNTCVFIGNLFLLLSHITNHRKPNDQAKFVSFEITSAPSMDQLIKRT